MIKKYQFNYDFGKASALFLVDTEKYTPELAKETLQFFTWSYDKEAHPVDEVMKKIVIEVFEIATSNGSYSHRVKEQFREKEGWPPIDGTLGVTLIRVDGFEFDEDDLTMEILEPSNN